ncbi:unnamed protein product, partial [Rotaria sp. Silwood2]
SFPWILNEGEINPSTTIIFTDYDDPAQSNKIPFRVEILSPSNFTLSGPTLNYVGGYQLTYNGILNTYPISDGFKTINVLYMIDFVQVEHISFVITPDALYPGSYTIHVDVTKPIASSTDLSTIDLSVTSIYGEFVRQAATICVQGEYPETLIDPSIGNRLSILRNALASFLLFTTDSIIILAIRPVYQYRSLYDPSLPFNQAKQRALTDVIFYVAS